MLIILFVVLKSLKFCGCPLSLHYHPLLNRNDQSAILLVMYPLRFVTKLRTDSVLCKNNSKGTHLEIVRQVNFCIEDFGPGWL